MGKANEMPRGWEIHYGVRLALPWEKDKDIPLHGYPCGTWGPEVADAMIDGEEYTWRYPCKNLADDGLYCEL